MAFLSIKMVRRGILFLTSYVALVILVVLFAAGSYHWAMRIGRVPSLAINPVMYPLFTEVNVSVVDGNREPHYRLFRTYDYYADAFASPRRHGPHTRVPIVYVHGNAGSYSCARSLARFLYEANVNLRVAAHRSFADDTKAHIVDAMRADGSWQALKEGQPIPRTVRQEAEAFVVRTSHPVLASELFTVDFIEESFTQSGVLTIKSARFLNHSLHVLMHEFLRAHKTTLDAPVNPIFDAESLLLDTTATDDDSEGSASAGEADAAESSPRTSLYEAALEAHRLEGQGNKVLRKAREEYAASLCRPPNTDKTGPRSTETICQQVQQHLERFSVQERVRDEVQRTRDGGMWIWGESLGGTLSILAAILSPELVAGIVLVASPVRYQPLFFDVSTAWLFRSISDAATRSALLLTDQPTLTADDWTTHVLPHDSPIDLIRQLSAVAPVDLAARLDRVLLLAVNGGALDDVVPSTSGALQRSFPRVARSGEAPSALANLSRAQGGSVVKRRDISTEVLRWCGWPMDHRGLVYSLQFLQASAASLASAALLPNASEYFYRDSWLPSDVTHSPTRTRLFPSVVETVTGASAQLAEQRAFEMAALKTTSGGRLVKSRMMEQLYEGFEEICVGSSPSEPLDANLFTVFDETDGTGYYNGSKTLTVLLGYTTLPSEKIKSTTLSLYRDPARSIMVSDTDVTTELSTKLHLPVLQKGSQATPGLVLRTVYSFTPRRKLKRRAKPQHVYAEFCVLVDNRDAELAEHHHTYVQGNQVDAAAFQATQRPALGGSAPVFVGNALQVEAHHNYVLMSGVHSTTLETDLHVATREDAAVYPFTFCGSLHAFYLALRGDSRSAAGDPDAQLQLFFGTYTDKAVTHAFHYQWKPFSTVGGTLNETYLCYAVGDNTVSAPTVQARDLAALSALPAVPLPLLAPSASVVQWWTRVWPGRWLAHFSITTGIARCGGSGVLLFFQLYMLFGWMRWRFCGNPQLAPSHDRGFLRRVSHHLTPLWALFLVALVMEVASGALAEAGLRVCRDMSADPTLSDAARTAQMGALEKLTLLALWLAPRYQECQYAWIQAQVVPVWANLMEHMATIYISFVVAVILLILSMVVVQLACGVVGAPLARCVVRPLVTRSAPVGAVLLALLWALPTALWCALPWLPLCYVDLAAAVMGQTIIWSIPWSLAPGLHYWWPCVELCVACWFPSHFNGLVLTIRNHVVLRDTPALFWDPERYHVTAQQRLVYACIQMGLAAVYCTVFCTIRSAQTLKLAALAKKAKDEAPPSDRAVSSKAGDSRRADPVRTAVASSQCEYLMGDFSRRLPLWRRLCRTVRATTLVLSVWASIVASRRPLEGGVTLCGNVALAAYLATFLMEYW